MSRANEKDEMTHRLAAFKGEFSTVMVFQLVGNDEDYSPLADYVRISEWKSVTFQPLSNEAVIGSQLTALTKLRAKTVDDFAAKLSDLDGRMANLRALTGPVSS